MKNAMPRTPSAHRPLRSAGQSVYEVMLIIACAAMLLAVILAAQEYFSFYQGPAKPNKFEVRDHADADGDAPGAGSEDCARANGARSDDDAGLHGHTRSNPGAGNDALN